MHNLDSERLARRICCADDGGRRVEIVASNRLRSKCLVHLDDGRQGKHLAGTVADEEILDGLRRLAGEQVAVASPVLLCATPARYYLKRLLEPFLPKVVVLSPLEVPPVIEVQSVGVLR